MAIRSFRFTAMASPCSLHFEADSDLVAEVAASDAMDEVRRIEERYSRYRPESELSRINAAARDGGEAEVDAETAALIDFAFAAYEKSGGLFDISSGLLRKAWNFDVAALPARETIAPLLARIGLDHVRWQNPMIGFARPGMELDFGGVGKEYAVDRAVEVLRSYGITHGLVDLGGDIGVTGPEPDGTPWSIGIANPRQPDDLLASVPLAAGGLAGSGDYERFIEVDGRRYCHILDPRTGMSVQGLSAVSVIAGTCLAAGAIATTAMLKGCEGPAWLASLGLPYLCVDAAGEIGGTLAPAGE